MKGRILLTGGCVLTLDPKVGNLRRGDVLIEDGRIGEVGEGLRARGAEVVDATDTIVMPGFIDTHRHVWESLFRNLGDAAPPAIYGPHYEPDDVYAATLIGMLGAIDAGITTVVDWADIGPGEAHMEAAFQAHAESGVRSVLAYANPPWSPGDEQWRSGLGRLTKMTGGQLLTLAAGAPTPRSGHVDRVAADWALARELGLRIHTLAGSETSDRGVVSDLGLRGLLGGDVTLIHCSNLGDSDLDAIASSGAFVSLAPSSEMSGGLGSLPIQKLIDRGIRPGLAVDTERVAPGDMFAQMRAAISLQHATLFDLKLTGKAGLPQLLSTREVIRYATIAGAGVAGLGRVTGSLERGKQADIVVLRTDRPNVFPINDPIGAVVWGMDTSNVDSVFVAGLLLKRDGVLQTDVARARNLAVAAQRRVAAASGLLVDAGSEGVA